MNTFIFVLYSRLNLKIEPIAYLRIKIDKPTGWILLNSYSNFRTKALHSKVYKSSIMGHSTRVASFKGQGNSGQVGFYIIPISWAFQKFATPKNLGFRIFVGLRSWFLWLSKEFLENCYKINDLNGNEWSRMNMNEFKALEKNEKLKLFQTIRRCGSRAYLRSAF